MNSNNYNSNSIRKNIVEKADIVNIISQYVKLEKRGNNYIGLCPFHDDKNPSMSVSPQKKVFKCFSCGTAGDVVTFVSKIKNISIGQALREAGETVGIKVAMSQEEIERQRNQKFYDILQEASSFYHFYLNNTNDGKNGLLYLNNRKLSSIEIERFNIGLAGENDILYKTLNEKKYFPLDMIEVGLIRGGEYYHDVFRNRIIFPIKDLNGNVVGFSGRKYLDKDNSESKYINTNETKFFKKGDILYNYSDCIKDIKNNDNVYLFEGFMDVIAAVRAGINNSVASMGTSLTINQIKAIARVTKNVTLCYDSDGPGVAATIKAISLLINSGLNVNVALIPDGKDADEYIYNNGKEKLHYCLVDNVISAIEFLYKYEKKNSDLTNYNSIEIFKNNIFNYLSLFKSNIIVEKILNDLARDLNVSVENLISDYNKNRNNLNNNVQTKKESENIISNNLKQGNKRFEYSLKKYLLSERRLILACYNNKKSCLEIENLLDNHYYEEINRNILFKLLKYYRSYDTMNNEILFLSLLDDEKETLLSIIENETLPNNKEIKTLINNIKIWPYDKVINMLNNKADKTPEDLQRITEYKSKITIIKKDKE